MIPRKKLDLRYSDLFFGFRTCLRSLDRGRIERDIATVFGNPGTTAAFLSVRSGFDLVLQQLDWPKGSEVLVSAITISDMPKILLEHGLVPVPVDLEAEDLSLNPSLLQRLIGPNTRGVLFAHLFGTVIDLAPLVEVCRQHSLFLFEDCAQAYLGNFFKGSPGCDVSMFSFGPIKTCSALGGAVFQFQDPALAVASREHEEKLYLKQSRRQFFLRLVKYLGLKVLSHGPVFTFVAWMFRATGKDFDRTLSMAVKSFPGPGLLERLRKRLSDPQLALLAHKLRTFQGASLRQRTAKARFFLLLSPDLKVIGDRASHSYWVFAVRVEGPAAVGSRLRERGFDATTQASNMRVCPTVNDGPPPAEAASILARLLYLPVYQGVKHSYLRKLAKALPSN